MHELCVWRRYMFLFNAIESSVKRSMTNKQDCIKSVNKDTNINQNCNIKYTAREKKTQTYLHICIFT